MVALTEQMDMLNQQGTVAEDPTTQTLPQEVQDIIERFNTGKSSVGEAEEELKVYGYGVDSGEKQKDVEGVDVLVTVPSSLNAGNVRPLGDTTSRGEATVASDEQPQLQVQTQQPTTPAEPEPTDTAPVPTEAEGIIKPIEPEAPVTTPEQPPAQQPVDRPDITIPEPTGYPMGAAIPGISTAMAQQNPLRKPPQFDGVDLIGSFYTETMEAITGRDDRPDPLQVPDPFVPENHRVLYDMFFKQDDEVMDQNVRQLLMSATGFVLRTEDVGRDKTLGVETAENPDGEIISFAGLNTVEERAAFLVAMGGVALAYPEFDDAGKIKRNPNGGVTMYDTSTKLPVLQELEMYRRESVTDITMGVPFDATDAELTLVDMPRETLGPEGQKQLDDYLIAIGMTPYERLAINRAEFSGYFPDLKRQEAVGDLLSLPQTAVTGMINFPLHAVHKALAQFAAVPDQNTGEKLTDFSEAPQIPYPPTFAEELAYRLNITKSQAEGLITYEKDALTRGQRIAGEATTVLLGMYGGRNLMDKKRLDQFVEFLKTKFNVKNVEDLPNAILREGKAVDSLVVEFVNTRVKSVVPFPFMQNVARRGAIRALQRVEKSNAKWLGIDAKNVISIHQRRLEDLDGSIKSLQNKIDDLGDPKNFNDVQKSNFDALTKQKEKLAKQFQKEQRSGLGKIMPESLKFLYGVEALALTGAAVGGQYWQDVQLAGESIPLGKASIYAEAAGAVSLAIATPLLAMGAYKTVAGVLNYTNENLLNQLIAQTTEALTRKETTGDAQLDKQLDAVYSAIKRAPPEFRRYILDQFDQLREMRTRLSNAVDGDGNPLLTKNDLNVTFANMTGMMVYEAFEAMIRETIPSTELGKVTPYLMELQSNMVEQMLANNRFAEVVQRVTKAGVADPDVQDIAAFLRAINRNQQRTLREKFDATQNLIQSQEAMAQAYLSGDLVFDVDTKTGELFIPDLEQVFAMTEQSLIDTAIQRGTPEAELLKQLEQLSMDRAEAYRTGLDRGVNVLTSQPGHASTMFHQGTATRRYNKYKETGKMFDDLRADYPDAFADASFLLERLSGIDPQMIDLLGMEVSQGALRLANVGVSGSVKSALKSQLDTSAKRFQQNLVEHYGVDADDVGALIEEAGGGRTALEQYVNLRKYLLNASRDAENGDELASRVFGEGATRESLASFAKEMELPVNFAEAHLIASALGRMSDAAQGLQASNFKFLRENFLEALGKENGGFRQVVKDADGRPKLGSNGEYVYETLGKEIMDRYAKAREYYRVEYAERFLVPGTYTHSFTKDIPGYSEGLPLHQYNRTNHPTTQLRKLINGIIPDFEKRVLSEELDGDRLRTLENELARVFGEYDPQQGTYVLDLDTEGAKELSMIIQALATEEILKSGLASSFYKTLEDEGFKGLYELFKKKPGLFPDDAVNHNLIENLTALRGYRKGADGKYVLETPAPVVTDIEVLRAVSPERQAQMSQKARAVIQGLQLKLKDKTRVALSENSQVRSQLQESLDDRSTLIAMLQSNDPAGAVINDLRNGGRKLDELRDDFILQMVRQSGISTEEAGRRFDGAVREQIGQYIADRFIKVTAKSVEGEQMKYVSNPEGILEVLGANNPRLAEGMEFYLGKEHYQILQDVALFYGRKQGASAETLGLKFLTPTSFTPEAIYSRLNNINKGVAGARWTAVEFLMRSLRASNFDVLTEMFRNPEVAEVFETMILTDKPLSATFLERMENTLSNLFVKSLVMKDIPGVETVGILRGGEQPEIRQEQDDMTMMERIATPDQRESIQAVVDALNVEMIGDTTSSDEERALMEQRLQQAQQQLNRANRALGVTQ